MTYNPQTLDTQQQQTLKSSSSTSTSSDSTSLSKYITSSKHSTIKHSASNPVTKNSVNLSHKNLITSQDDSVSNSIDATSTSSTTTSSSTSTSTSISTNPTQTSKSKQPRSILIESNTSTSIVKPKTRIVQDLERDKESMRYSPSSLERLLHAGMNYLDTLNASALQLEELDKVRCIGFAQQETVALAHLLKENKTKQDILIQQQQQHQNTKTTKSRSHSMSSNLSSSSTSNSTSSSYEHENEIETESEVSKKMHSHRSKQSRSNANDSRKSMDREQDVSVINTISEMNNTTTDKRTNTFIEDDDEMEKSFRQVLPVKNYIEKSKQDQSFSYDLSQSSFSQFDNHPNGLFSKRFIFIFK